MSFLWCPLGEWVVLLFVVILSDVFMIALSGSVVYVLWVTGSVMLRSWNL